MTDKIPAVEPKDPPAAEEKVEVPTTPTTEDLLAQIAQLETEKAKAIEEAANYKLGLLKAKGKNADDELLPDDETEEERIRRIVKEENAAKTIASVNAGKDELLVRLAKENKELKLAQANKLPPPSSDAPHNEGPRVQDTVITQEQLTAFKARGWTDKDIERYKKNLRRYA